MTDSTGIQVANQKEDTQVAFIQSVVAFLQDATNLPKLRQEVEGLRAEAEVLKRRVEELQITIDLEREEKTKFSNKAGEEHVKVGKLESRLASLQHKFDTIQGIVAAAMAEAEADKPKIAIVKEPEPWTPSTPPTSALPRSSW